jgi:hypothetical protein
LPASTSSAQPEAVKPIVTPATISHFAAVFCMATVYSRNEQLQDAIAVFRLDAIRIDFDRHGQGSIKLS